MNPRVDSAPVVEGTTPAPRPPAGRWRWAVNAWLVFHVTAIIIAPASVAPASDLARSAWDVVHPYLQLLDLNHGYHFFAPEPAESTLIAYVAEREDGTEVHGRIPHFRIWPRLLYHRHFMLTEHVADAPEELRPLWHESYARRIGREHGATRVHLTQITHLLSSTERVLEGGRLDDPESYEELPLGTFRCEAD